MDGVKGTPITGNNSRETTGNPPSIKAEPIIKTESPRPSPVPRNSSQSRSSAERKSLQRQLDALRTQHETLETQANAAELRAHIPDEQRRIAEAEQRIRGAETMPPAEFVILYYGLPTTLIHCGHTSPQSPSMSAKNICVQPLRRG
ncbi:uncharacterized protein TRUGW13939_00966 [Talaromyces rugulosus]|uniref:Uncharacterized protein n=1 Tax=Talaromyces rugulosus TaxID=121627 RepID=A0A7H8QIZ4_TALRU|nr:uncharacterized protein TRUGW13939_00966 [Talaromyces rugulosus]QKX53886.1 hypothetical protein TRUGW13939_00966 [Talaromyces rugulosus]